MRSCRSEFIENYNLIPNVVEINVETRFIYSSAYHTTPPVQNRDICSKNRDINIEQGVKEVCKTFCEALQFETYSRDQIRYQMT